MKKLVILFGLLLIVIFFVGCSSQKEQVTGSKCPRPYTIVGANCCLDNNNNGLCDTDEASNDTIVLMEGANVAEKCTGGTNLDCVGYKIGVDSIRLKFQSVSKDFIKVKRIILTNLGCSQNYESLIELRYNDAQDFEIPCKSRHTTIDTEISILEDVRNVKIKTNGEVYDVSEPIETKNVGHISGRVII